MRALLSKLLVAAGLLSFVSCKTADRTSQVASADSETKNITAEMLMDAGNPIFNFGRAGPHLYRGGQLLKFEDRYKFLAEVVGIKKVINLQTFHGSDNAQLCAKYGMSCVKHDVNPLAIDWLPVKFDWKTFQAAFAEAKASIEKGENVYVHCYIGKDRTGALITALTIYPTVCSGKPYDADAMEKSILEKYEEFGISLPMRGLKAEVVSWAKKPPTWLCL